MMLIAQCTYRIFLNLVCALFRAKKSNVDYNHMWIRFMVESWILEKDRAAIDTITTIQCNLF
jgi:hypothetical protein